MTVQDWTFDGMGAAFDGHVRGHLPWYELVTGAVALIARHYIPQGGLIYDIGASTGNVGRALATTIEERTARLVAIESVQDMANRYQAPGEIVVADAMTFDYEPYDMAIMFLTVMFMPVADRAAYIASLRRKCRPGGAMLIVDKCHPPPGYEGTIFARMTWAQKIEAGVSAEEIVMKELSLAGIQRPVTASELGRGAIEMFRFGDFAGWLLPA